MDFFNKKISTLGGIIILLIITFTVGCLFVNRIQEIQEVRMETLRKTSGVEF